MVFRPTLKYLIIFLASLALVLATKSANFSVSADTQKGDNAYLKEVLSDSDHYDAVEMYHKKINDIFNDRIGKMTEKMFNARDAIENAESNEDKNKAQMEWKKLEDALVPPGYNIVEETLSDGTTIKKNLGRLPCEAKDEQINLSTYCLAIDATEEYFKLRKALNYLKAQATASVVLKMKTKSGSAQPEGPPTFRQALESAEAYNADFADIDNEIALSRDVLDQALAAYSELQSALPLHFKYMDTIDELEKYRDAVAGIRRQIDFYPVIFKNITTAKCN